MASVAIWSFLEFQELYNLLSLRCLVTKWNTMTNAYWQTKARLPRSSCYCHGLRTPREEIAFTARPKIHSHSQIFRYVGSIFCLPHQPKFSDIFDLCLHWVSVVRAYSDEEELYSINNQNLGFLLRSPCKNVHINYNNILAKPFCCKISSKMYGEFFYAWKIVRLGPGFDLPCKIY